MFDEFIYEMIRLVPFVIIFPIFIIGIFLMFKKNLKKEINKNNIKFYGLFIELTNKDIVSISLLLLEYFIVVSSLFINEFTFINVIILFMPIIIFDLLNGHFIKIFIDVINYALIFLILYSKNIFFSYLIDVGNYWYVNIIIFLLSMFITLYMSFIFLRNFNSIIKTNKYIKSKSNV